VREAFWAAESRRVLYDVASTSCTTERKVNEHMHYETHVGARVARPCAYVNHPNRAIIRKQSPNTANPMLSDQ